MIPTLRLPLIVLFLCVGLGAQTPLKASDDQITIATFNIEWLGKPDKSSSWSDTRSSQISQAAEEILALNADIVALQEVIVDDLNGNALSDLLLELNQKDQTHDWEGIYSDRFSFWWSPNFVDFPAMRQAFVWRRTNIQYVTATTLPNSIPSGDPRFASGRIPLMLELKANLTTGPYPLHLINLHLKCCPGSDTRRFDSMTTLLETLNNQYADKALVVLGDFNVADRGGANGEIAEWGYYEDADLDGNPDFFHAAGSLTDIADYDIDHILLSNELSEPYLSTIRSERNVKAPTSISDHNPILTQLTFGTQQSEECRLSIAGTETKITIDGAIDSAWTDFEQQAVEKITIGSQQSATDLSAFWRAHWNKSSGKVLFLIEVIDDDISTDYGTEIWFLDSIEIYIDADNSKDLGTSATDSGYDGINDYQLRFLPRENDRVHVFGAYLANSAIISAYEITDNGYRYEIELDLAKFGVNFPLTESTLIGFDLQIADSDNNWRDYKKGWCAETDDTWFNPSLFGELELTGVSHTQTSNIIQHTNGGIQVDGYRELGWDNATRLNLSQLISGSITNPADFSADGWMIWNEVGLYLFVEIQDDVFVDNETIFSSPWQDDSIELYLDLDNSKNVGYYDENDIQIFLNFQNPWFRQNNDNLNVGQISSVTTKRPESGHKTAEILVPWNFFKTRVIQGGQKIGFDLILNDDDDGFESDAKLSWHTTTTEAYFDPSAMGTIELGGSASYDFNSPSFQRTDHILYVILEYQDTPASISLQEAEQWAQSMEEFFEESSDSRYLVAIDVVPAILTLPGPKNDYATSNRDLHTDIRNLIAENQEFRNLHGNSYDYHIWSYPSTWREYGGAWGEGIVWVDGTGPGSGYSKWAEGWTIIAHEMGHAIGLSHASMTSGTRISPLVPGEWLIYGSPEDIMGNPPSYGEFGLPSKSKLGWLLPNQLHIDPNPGTYRVYAHDQENSNELQGIRLTNPRFGERGVKDYWISVRATSAMENQPIVQIHLSTAEVRYHHGHYASELLDMSPEDGNVYKNILGTNKWYWDSWNNHAFKIQSLGNVNGKAWADIEIQTFFDGANANVLHAHLGETYSYVNGWCYTKDFAFLQLVRNGYAYHPETGWLYIADGDFENGLILYHVGERRWYYCSRTTPLTPIGS